MALEGARYLARNSRLPVRTDSLPAAYRVAVGLPTVDAISTAATQEKALQDHNRTVIREAIEYTPTFAREIGAALADTHMLLLEHGFSPDTGSSSRQDAIDEKVEETLGPVGQSYKKPDQTGISKDVVRDLSRLVHPDTADPALLRVLLPQKQTQVLNQALDAARKQNAERAQNVAVTTLAPYLVEKVRELLAQGQTFEQIAQNHPEIAPQMDYVQYLAHLRLPKPNAYRRFAKPEEADKEAERIRRKADVHARTAGFGLVQSVVDEVTSFAGTKATDPAVLTELQSIYKFMDTAYGWVGSTGEFEIQQGSRVVTPYAGTLRAKIEEFIRALPERVYTVAEALVSPDISAEDMSKLLLQLRSAVASVKSSAERYGHALEDEANRRYALIKEDSYSNRFYRESENKEIIFQKDIFNKEKNY